MSTSDGQSKARTRGLHFLDQFFVQQPTRSKPGISYVGQLRPEMLDLPWDDEFLSVTFNIRIDTASQWVDSSHLLRWCRLVVDEPVFVLFSDPRNGPESLLQVVVASNWMNVGSHVNPLTVSHAASRSVRV